MLHGSHILRFGVLGPLKQKRHVLLITTAVVPTSDLIMKHRKVQLLAKVLAVVENYFVVENINLFPTLERHINFPTSSAVGL